LRRSQRDSYPPPFIGFLFNGYLLHYTPSLRLPRRVRVPRVLNLSFFPFRPPSPFCSPLFTRLLFSTVLNWLLNPNPKLFVVPGPDPYSPRREGSFRRPLFLLVPFRSFPRGRPSPPSPCFPALLKLFFSLTASDRLPVTSCPFDLFAG